MLIYAWYCALTRVSDYKHHPTDVLAGGVLGLTMAVVMGLLPRSEKPDITREESKVRDRLLKDTREL